MRGLSLMLASAAVACGGVMFSAHAQQAQPSVGQQVGDAVQKSGDAVGQAARDTTDAAARALSGPDTDDIRKTVATGTEAAVTKSGFDDLIERFVDADRKRLSDYKAPDNFAKLDGRIDQFRKDWKDKYGQEFSFENKRGDVLNDQFARISQGTIGEARTAAGKEVPTNQPGVAAGSAEDLKKSGAAQPDANSAKTAGGDTNKEAGRAIASMVIPASAGKPELAVPLIREFPDSWKIDVPDSIDGQKLYDNLLKHITMVDEARATWPADVNEAYRAVTRHMLTAVMESGDQAMKPLPQ